MTTIKQTDRDAADHWRARLPSIDVDDYYALIQAFARHCEQAEAETVAGIVAWLRAENGRCDCFAKEEGECACGGWDDYKTWPLERTADAIKAGEWKK